MKRIMSTDVVCGFNARVESYCSIYTYLNEVFLWSKRIGFESLDLVVTTTNLRKTRCNRVMDRKKKTGTMNSDIFYVEQDVRCGGWKYM